MNIEKYSTSGPIKGICKQSAVWGHEGNSLVPLIYIQRPKWIKDDAVWSQIVESIRLDLPTGMEIN